MPYCQFCGTKLEEGQVCSCELAQQAAANPSPAQQPEQQPIPAATPPVNAKKNHASPIIKELKAYLSAYIANPTQAVCSVMEAKTLTLPIVLFVARLLLMGLAIYGLLRKICSEALSFITSSVLRYGNTSDILTAKLTASFPKCLVFGSLIAAVCMFLFMILLFLLTKIQHRTLSLSDIFKASAANGLPASVLLLLSFRFSFVSITPCLIFMILAMLVWMISGVLTVRLVCPDGNSSAFWLLYFVGVVLIAIAGYYVIPPLLLRAVGGISASYMGKTIALQSVFDTTFSNINNALAEEGISSFGEFFRNGLKESLDEMIYDIWNSIY